MCFRKIKSYILLFIQRTKKVVSDSLPLVDFGIGLVNFVHGHVKLLRNSNDRRTV